MNVLKHLTSYIKAKKMGLFLSYHAIIVADILNEELFKFMEKNWNSSNVSKLLLAEEIWIFFLIAILENWMKREDIWQSNNQIICYKKKIDWQKCNWYIRRNAVTAQN